VTNERDSQRALQGPDLRSSSTDLLDLVRSAEDDARLALRKRTPAVATVPTGLAPREEEVVEVGDDAIDAPPSMPPMRSATPAGAFAAGPRSSPRSAPLAPAAPIARGLPPAAGIVVIFALAIFALALVTR
jgi:hypothetical protein